MAHGFWFRLSWSHDEDVTYQDVVSRFLGTSLFQAVTTKAVSHVFSAPLVPGKSRCMIRREILDWCVCKTHDIFKWQWTTLTVMWFSFIRTWGMSVSCQKPQSCPTTGLSRVQVTNGHSEHIITLWTGFGHAGGALWRNLHCFLSLGIMKGPLFQCGPARSCQQIPTVYNPRQGRKTNVKAAILLAAPKILHTQRQKISLLLLLHSSVSSCSISKGWILTASFLGDASTLNHEYIRKKECSEKCNMGVYGAHDSRYTNFRSYHLSS